MAERTVRTLTNPSNRAQVRDAADRKVVFRSVLDNPFRIPWPSIPVNIQNSIMACVVDMVEGVSEYHLTREAHSRKRKRAQKGSNDRTAKRHQSERPITQMNNDDGQAATAPKTHASDCGTVEEMHGDVSSNAVEPSILQHLTIGINEVTKLLERTAQSFRQTITVGSSVAPQTRTEHRSHMILVCRGDVDPPLLIQHLPHLVAACNSRRASGSENVTWLIPLSKGSESSLASALGLRRVSVVAVDGNAPRFAMLSALLENVPVLKASWLSSPTGQVETLVPTHIKQLHTTAPRDMKSAKEQRAGGRAAAKERRKARAK